MRADLELLEKLLEAYERREKRPVRLSLVG
jgi:hypothetical protein